MAIKVSKMQLKNKILSGKWLITILPMLISIAACSYKKADNNQCSIVENNLIHGDTSCQYTNQFISRQMMQELQNNNNVVYFDFDKYDIASEHIRTLDQHVVFLRANPLVQVTIEGHTDERGTPEFNISLGERRANAVKMYLQSKGVSDKQVIIVSYGKEKPAVLGHNETTHAKNRRAVLVY